VFRASAFVRGSAEPVQNAGGGSGHRMLACSIAFASYSDIIFNSVAHQFASHSG
jgi:hypothetical protein